MNLNRLPVSELEQSLALDSSSEHVQHLLHRYAMATGTISSTIQLQQQSTQDMLSFITMREALLSTQIVLVQVWEKLHSQQLVDSQSLPNQEIELSFADVAAELCDVTMLAAAHGMDDLAQPIFNFLTLSLPDIVPVKVAMITALITSGRYELAEALASQTLHDHPKNESAIAGMGLTMKALHRDGWPLLFQHLHSTSVDEVIVSLASDMLEQVTPDQAAQHYMPSRLVN
jgi:hypothetical protein